MRERERYYDDSRRKKAKNVRRCLPRSSCKRRNEKKEEISKEVEGETIKKETEKRPRGPPALRKE